MYWCVHVGESISIISCHPPHVSKSCHRASGLFPTQICERCLWFVCQFLGGGFLVVLISQSQWKPHFWWTIASAILVLQRLLTLVVNICTQVLPIWNMGFWWSWFEIWDSFWLYSYANTFISISYYLSKSTVTRTFLPKSQQNYKMQL